MQVLSLGREDTLEEGIATHSNILAWRITWTDRVAWWATVHRDAKSQTWLNQFSKLRKSKCYWRLAVYLPMYLSIISLSIYLSIEQVLSSHSTCGSLIFIPDGWEKNYLLGPQIIKILIPTAFFLLFSILCHVIFLMKVGIFFSFLLIAFEKDLLF